MNKKSDEINLVSVIMGSKSDWTTMQDTCIILDDLKIDYILFLNIKKALKSEVPLIAKEGGFIKDGLSLIHI